jgi:hypothetical protein
VHTLASSCVIPFQRRASSTSRPSDRPSILTSIRARAADQRRCEALRVILGRVAQEHPLPRPIGGTMEVLQALTSFVFDAFAGTTYTTKQVACVDSGEGAVCDARPGSCHADKRGSKNWPRPRGRGAVAERRRCPSRRTGLAAGTVRSTAVSTPFEGPDTVAHQSTTESGC